MEKVAKRKIHVSNIPYELKKADIIELFETIGPVFDCELINDKNTGKFKGSAKIEYPDYFCAKAAIRNLNRFEIKGRQLKISYANHDKNAKDMRHVIVNEDEFSDPEDFEERNKEKKTDDAIIDDLTLMQKVFIL